MFSTLILLSCYLSLFLILYHFFFFFFFFNDTATTEIYTLSLHDALPISEFVMTVDFVRASPRCSRRSSIGSLRSEEHTSELQSLTNLVCRLLLEKKKKKKKKRTNIKKKIKQKNKVK